MSLQEMIRTRGLKQGWIARQIGLSESAFSRILNGFVALPHEKHGPLAHLLRLRPAELDRQLTACRQWGEGT